MQRYKNYNSHLRADLAAALSNADKEQNPIQSSHTN